MAANDAVSMNVAENRQNVPMAIQENRAAVPMTVAEGGGTPGGLNGKADKVTGAVAGNLAGLDANGNLTDSGKAPEDFLEAPADAGSEGQVLTADGEGGASWQDPTGGDPTEIIDDNAGSGDTDKVWSADKSAGEAQSLMTEITNKADEPTGTKVAGKVYGLDNSLNPVWVDGASIDPSDIAEAVDAWLDEHPEATTTVEDGSITEEKLANDTKEIIGSKASAIVLSKSGRVVSFDDHISGTTLKDCTVQIEPIQTGTGTPSSQNIRPIVGWTGCKVYSTGKNLLDPSLFSTANSQYIKYETGGVKTWSGSFRASDYVPVVAGLQYTLHAAFNTQDDGGLAFYDSSKQYISGIQMNSSTKMNYTFTVPAGAAYMRFCDRTELIAFTDVFLVLGDTAGTKTTYVEGDTETVTWQTEAGTIYGGEIGSKLKKTWDVIASYNGETLPGRWISDRDVYAAGTTPTTGAQVAYELAEPVEYSVSLPAISTLDGLTFIFADCGEVDATYRADTMKYLNGQFAEKQDVLTFDQTPTTGSENPVTSGGVKSAIGSFDGKINAIGDGYSIINDEYVRGSGSDNGTYSASNQRIVNSSLVSRSGVYRIITNGQKVYIRTFDNNGVILWAKNWVTDESYDFCVPTGCSYQLTIAKTDDSNITVAENATILYKVHGYIENANGNTEIIDNFIKNPGKIQVRIPAEGWWNKRLDTDLTEEASSTRIDNSVSPIALKTGDVLTVICTGTGQRFGVFIYTVSGSVKTAKVVTGWRTADYTYEATEDCYCVINNGFSNDGSITPLDAGVAVFKNTGSGDYLPEYWRTYLDTQIPTIKGNIHDVGNTGDTFMLVTDTHWETNRRNSPAVMKYLKDKTNISFAVNCGDLIQGVATASGALDLLEDYQNKIKGIEPFYCVRGNHDTNMDGDYHSGEITEGQWYSIIDKPIEKVADTGKHAYFYKDNESQKIRYIFMDFTNVMTWLGSVVASTPSGYSIVVFTHYLFSPEAATHTGDLEVSSFGQSIINALDSNKPNDVEIIGIFAGHVHRDFATTSTNGYLLVGTTCDANAASYFDPVTPSRTAGTTGEQVVDVVSINTYSKTVKMLRIGAGASRNLSYGNT